VNAFPALKALLRKSRRRTVYCLGSAIGLLIELFGPDERRNYFAARRIRCNLINYRSS
jgi:hypothetical protein